VKNRIISILLASVLALSVGLIGCGGEGGPEVTEYTLTISSTDGGDSTCVPAVGCTCGEGTESSGGLNVPEECLCAEGTEVSIEATAKPGYRFVNWTGDVDTIANADAAKTTITMNSDYSITANFIAQGAVPDHEPPINIFLVLHIDPLGELGAEEFKPEPTMYTRTRDEIDWLMIEAARHNLRFSALYNGWYPKWALDHNDFAQFAALVAAGHEIGSHSHQITYDQQTDTWITHTDELSIYGRPNYDPELARQAWNDASYYVEAVLDAIGATGQNRINCSTALSLSDERNLMTEFGFTIAAGNRLEASANYFGHMSWNPWRASNSDEPGYEIAEDLSAPYVSINHGAQIGSSESHSTYATVNQLQRQFLMLYAEWLARERTGAEDRVWSFGFIYHPNQGDKYNADLIEFLDWLDMYFIAEKSPYGNTIARYAMVSEIAAEFYAWEAAHPGVSSFNYVRDDPYPYTYAVFASILAGASYEAHIDLEEGVTCLCFSKDGKYTYMVWSDEGAKAVDLSTIVSEQVLVINVLGQKSVLNASSLPLTEEPILVAPTT
jgi:hypothetical protein